MIDYSIGDIVKAVKGELLSGDPRSRVTGVETDSREIRAGHLFVALSGERYDGHDFAGAAVEAGARAVLIKGDRLPRPELPSSVAAIAVADTLAALGDLARAHLKRLPGRRVAVTGSVGKTSTRRLIASAVGGEMRLLETAKNYNNWIGVPKTAFGAGTEDEVLLFEFGADRPGEIKYLTGLVEPEIGVITHVGPSHLERFKTVEGVADEKSEIFRGLRGAHPAAVYNSACGARAILDDAAGGRACRYGNREDSQLWAESICYDDEGNAAFQLSCSKRWTEGEGADSGPWRLRVPGPHQVTNTLAAIAVARLLGVSWPAIRQGIESYEGFPGRLRIRKLSGDLVLLEDIYNANPLSMEVALETLSRIPARRRIAVLGGMLDLGADSAACHETVGRKAAECGVNAIIACGEHSDDLFRGAREKGIEPSCLVRTENAEASGAAAARMLRPGDAVLVKGSRGMVMEKAVAIIEEQARPAAMN